MDLGSLEYVFCIHTLSNTSPSKFLLFIGFHLFCAMTEKHKTNAGGRPDLEAFPPCSDGFIYFDYRPPSERWPSLSLLAGNGNRMGNGTSLVTCLFLFWKAIICVAVVYMCHNPQSRVFHNKKKTEKVRQSWKLGGEERQMAGEMKVGPSQ